MNGAPIVKATPVVVLLLALAPRYVSAATISYAGTFTDPNQVFEASFTLSAASSVLIQTYGYGGSGNAPGGTNGAGTVIAAGGFDPYVSLFAGTGATATFLASNDDGACGAGSGATALGNCFDSTLSVASLAAGSYTVALTQPANFSIAENYGYGTLGDGFIDLAGDFTDGAGNLRSGGYALDVSVSSQTQPPPPPPSSVPEAGTLAVVASALTALFAVRLRDRRACVGQS